MTSILKMPNMGQSSKISIFFVNFSKYQCQKVEKLSEKWPNAILMHFGWVFGIFDTVSHENHYK